MTRWRGLVLVCTLGVWTLAGCAAKTAPGGAAANGTGGINRPEHRDKPHLILVSFDGFKPEYLERFDLPNFRRVLARGARARAMIPVFPSLTFPNHYSLVTGLHPGRHGIVANRFYDPARDQTYALGDPETVTDGSWYGGEPIWVTAETQGMVAACYFWPGSEAAIRGVRPSIWTAYDGDVPNEQRVATVLDWLRLAPERRPHMITLYFSELDTASHRGPLDSPAVEQAARSLDRVLGLLADGLAALPVGDKVHLLLTSDHGMVETSTAQTVKLDALVDPSLVRVAFGGPVANLHVHGGPPGAQRVRDSINARLGHGRAYLREDLPGRFHYSDDPRAGDVVVVMEEGWTLATSNRSEREAPERWGMHGWDPALPSMHALFAIAGPGIAAGLEIPEVHNVDVYPMMTELLGLRSTRDIDGQPSRILQRIRQRGSPAPAASFAPTPRAVASYAPGRTP